jgi:putative Mn2+ efflux pump MntP
MDILTPLLISVGLAMDAMAVSLGIGTAGQIPTRRGKIRLAAHLGIFQSGMTLLGWLAGETIVEYVKAFDHWIAFGLLLYVSVNLIRSGLSKERKAFDQDPSTGKVLVLLSVATSIDAFAVGLSIALLDVSLLLSVAMIGLVAFLLSALGLFAGIRLGEAFGKRMEIAGGAILLIIGVRIVVTHVFL